MHISHEFYFICNSQEQGHSFTIGDVSRVIHGTLVAVSADNLGSCALGGFKEGSTAYRGCRHCMATVPEMRTKVQHNDRFHSVGSWREFPLPSEWPAKSHTQKVDVLLL